MKRVLMMGVAMVLGFCCAADAAIILQQGFEDYDLSFAGNAGDSNSVGGYMTGALYPATNTPPELNRLANAADTYTGTIQEGSNALAMTIGHVEGSNFGSRKNFRINTATPFADDGDAFDLTFWMKRNKSGSVILRLTEEDNMLGTPAILFRYDGAVQPWVDGSWTTVDTWSTNFWRQVKVDVNQSAMTYGVAYRDDAGDAWTDLNTAIGYTNALAFNGVNFFPHFGMGEDNMPARIYIDDIEVIPEPASLALLVLAAVALRRVWSRSKRQA